MDFEGERPDRKPLTTVTHARLRADQGDLAGARRLLREILEQRPGHREASELLGSLATRRGRAPLKVRKEGEPEAVSATSGDLATEFRSALGGGEAQERIRRLRKMLDRISEMRGKMRA